MKPTDSLPQKPATAEIRRRLAVILLIVSITTLAWLWVGGLITYAPGAVSPNEMQNIYLSRIMGYGLLSGVLQIAAIALIVTQRRSTDGARTVAEQSGEREPPMNRVLRSQFFGGGPVTAVVICGRICICKVSTLKLLLLGTLPVAYILSQLYLHDSK